jgi:hypothetical protein
VGQSSDNTGGQPDWVPDWAPGKATLDYLSTGLTALLLVGVAAYLVWHLAHGRSPGSAATIGAGVGVGGAGT